LLSQQTAKSKFRSLSYTSTPPSRGSSSLLRWMAIWGAARCNAPKRADKHLNLINHELTRHDLHKLAWFGQVIDAVIVDNHWDTTSIVVWASGR
jgi:hypothetical protein